MMLTDEEVLLKAASLIRAIGASLASGLIHRRRSDGARLETLAAVLKALHEEGEIILEVPKESSH